MSQRRGERGFILPLSVLLVLVLAISGSAFMQLDFLERRMAGGNLDNHSAFYLANAGLERARAVLQIRTDDEGGLTWTPVLQQLPPPAPQDPNSLDTDLSDPIHQLLCGSEPCVIPFFGAVIDANSPQPFPFDAEFSRGQYAVRAFDNIEATEEEPDADSQNLAVDTDQQLVVRAAGIVGNERKVLEATIQAVAGLKMINCDENFDSNLGAPDGDCPTAINCAGGQGDFCLNGHLPDRGPDSFPGEQLPQIQPNFYSDWQRFPVTNHMEITPIAAGPIEFKSIPFPKPLQNEYPLTENTHYLVHGDVIVNTSANNVVIFSTGQLTVKSVTLNPAILIGQGVSISGAATLRAPIPFPVLISESGIEIDGSATIEGNIWSFGPININAQHFRGTITAINGQINMNVNNLWDHPEDELDLTYYKPMPGFNYYPGQLVPAIAPGTWRELQ